LPSLGRNRLGQAGPDALPAGRHRSNGVAKSWFITGTSRGFGREWAAAALARGDRVASTARDPGTLDDLAGQYGDALLPMAPDVTNRDAALNRQ
jgi:NADP-dependent 3-hydroxy acid dehydrogenase YdfG